MGKKRKRNAVTDNDLLETARLFPAFRARGRQLSLIPESEQNRPPEMPKPEPDNRDLKEVFSALRTRPSQEEIAAANKAAQDFQLEHARQQLVG